MFFKQFSNVLIIPVVLFGLIAFGLVNINGVWQKKLDAEAEGVHLSRQQMSEELDEAYDLLNRYHPYAHLYRSRKELDLVYAAIKNDIRQDNDLATAYLLHARMMASVCDYHTSIFVGEHRLPRAFELYRIKSTLWPVRSRPLEIRDDELMVEVDGAMRSLVEINGTSQEALRDMLQAVWPKDGCLPPDTVNTQHFQLLYEMVLHGMWGERREAAYSYTDRDSTAEIKGKLDFEAKRRRPTRQNKYMSQIQLLHQSGFERPQRKSQRGLSVAQPYAFFSPQKAAVYLHLPDFKSYEAVGNDYKAIFSTIRAHEPKTLILDLRDSGGGNSRTEMLIAALLGVDTSKFVSYNVYRHGALHLPENYEPDGMLENWATSLESEVAQTEPRVGDNHMIAIKPETFDVPGLESKLYVLIGQRTASAAGILAAQLRQFRGATLVGMPTTVRANRMCARAPGTFEMPYSKLKLRIPIVCLVDETLPDGRVEPDILIDGYPASLIDRERKTLEFVLDKL
ncbi:S41 family peptidase [Cohaesibacter marisflavi]|uniref:S41 family peptidase n=1 Tax=Cohaesibacter marisflavi TaxID=655353 RepID=UPI0029C68AE0|nr:S41 family peptidase [Cohaesibacter marisflavi]